MITPEQYVEGVNSIYVEDPEYEEGGDGSNHKCDCIGMCRGGSHRAGQEDTPNMRGTNQAARKTIKNLQKIKKEEQLRLGDVVLKTRDKDDKSMPLPDRYRKGGSDYDPTWDETNFTHIGTVIQVNPLRIMHMTSPHALIDEKLGKWGYFGQLPWVSSETEEETPDVRTATVYADSGSKVKMRDKPSVTCRLYWEVPVGAQVILLEPGDKWSRIEWAGRSGYMMTKFLNMGQLYTVIISHQTRETAQKICEEYENAIMEEEVG